MQKKKMQKMRWSYKRRGVQRKARVILANSVRIPAQYITQAPCQTLM